MQQSILMGFIFLFSLSIQAQGADAEAIDMPTLEQRISSLAVQMHQEKILENRELIAKDIEKNLIYLAQGYQPEEVYKSEFEVGPIHLITPLHGGIGGELQVKIRHGAAMHECRVEGQSVKLSEPVHGVAAGQFAVFYDGDICLGSAIIL